MGLFIFLKGQKTYNKETNIKKGGKMLLKQVKKISPKEAQILNVVGEKMKLLNSITDAAFLCRDLDCDTTKLRTAREQTGWIEVAKNIGTFTKLKYELAGEFYRFTYRKTKWGDEIGELTFAISQPSGTSAYFNENIPCVEISLSETVGQKRKLFRSGLYYEEKNNGRLNAVAKQGNILELAQFFYCRRNLYEKIHTVLLENREGFEKVSNSFFVEDLITLFSVTQNVEKGTSFELPKENAKEQYSEKKTNKKNKIFLGGMLFYSKDPSLDDENLPRYNSEIWLDKRKHLLIETNATEGTYGRRKNKLFSGAKNKEFQEFLNRINDWAEQTVAMIDFAYAIYEKVKGKILVENI